MSNDNLPPGAANDRNAPWNQSEFQCPYCDGEIHECEFEHCDHCDPEECDCDGCDCEKCEKCEGTGIVDSETYREWEADMEENAAEDRADERRKYGD